MSRAARLPPLLLLVPLLALLGPVACGDHPPPPKPDSGTPPVLDSGTSSGNTDAGTHDAGSGETDSGTSTADAGSGETDAGTGTTDAGTGTTDAGTDGGTTACIPSGWNGGGGDPEVVADTSRDLLVRLNAIPGLTAVENPAGSRAPPAGYRFFALRYNQPADHTHPECQRFEQRLTLLHTADTKPMVLHTGGYYVSTNPSRSEPTQLLAANQLSVEHRFFPPSIPEPADWNHLTLRQSADDFHRITQALKPLYPGKWVSTGSSKGGETVVFFRRFYPDDVDATVAYVAPITRRDDERFPAFQMEVGGEAQAACRERLGAFQREVLSRRERMLVLLRAYAEERGLSYTRLGFDRALEHAVIDTYFAFWQYNAPANCEAEIPPPSVSDEELLAAVEGQTSLSNYSDRGMGGYDAYYYQSALELGWPRPYESHLGALIHHPQTNTSDVYAPPGIPFVFRPGAMPDIQDWVATRGERLMFIYGGLDPWTAAAYGLGSARDSFFYLVPNGNHGSRIIQLPADQQAEARATLNRWMGIANLKRAPEVSLEEEPPLFGPRMPPRLRTGDQP